MILFDNLPPEVLAQVFSLVGQARKGGEIKPFERDHVRAEGRWTVARSEQNYLEWLVVFFPSTYDPISLNVRHQALLEEFTRWSIKARPDPEIELAKRSAPKAQRAADIAFAQEQLADVQKQIDDVAAQLSNSGTMVVARFNPYELCKLECHVAFFETDELPLEVEVSDEVPPEVPVAPAPSQSLEELLDVPEPEPESESESESEPESEPKPKARKK